MDFKKQFDGFEENQKKQFQSHLEQIRSQKAKKEEKDRTIGVHALNNKTDQVICSSTKDGRFNKCMQWAALVVAIVGLGFVIASFIQNIHNENIESPTNNEGDNEQKNPSDS